MKKLSLQNECVRLLERSKYSELSEYDFKDLIRILESFGLEAEDDVEFLYGVESMEEAMEYVEDLQIKVFEDIIESIDY